MTDQEETRIIFKMNQDPQAPGKISAEAAAMPSFWTSWASKAASRLPSVGELKKSLGLQETDSEACWEVDVSLYRRGNPQSRQWAVKLNCSLSDGGKFEKMLVYETFRTGGGLLAARSVRHSRSEEAEWRRAPGFAEQPKGKFTLDEGKANKFLQEFNARRLPYDEVMADEGCVKIFVVEFCARVLTSSADEKKPDRKGSLIANVPAPVSADIEYGEETCGSRVVVVYEYSHCQHNSRTHAVKVDFMDRGSVAKTMMYEAGESARGSPHTRVDDANWRTKAGFHAAYRGKFRTDEDRIREFIDEFNGRPKALIAGPKFVEEFCNSVLDPFTKQ